MKVHIRAFIRRDLPEALIINPDTTEKQIVAMLRQRNCIGQVAEVDNTIVGYMFYELHKPKLTLLEMYVHPSYLRQDIGTQFIRKLKSKLGECRFELDCSVPEHNLPMQLLLRKEGFFGKYNRYNQSIDFTYIMERVPVPNPYQEGCYE